MIYSTEVTKYNHDNEEWLNRFDELIINECGDGTVFEFMKKFCHHRFVIKLNNIQQFLDNNTINSYVNFTKENPAIKVKFCFYRESEYGSQLKQMMIQNGIKFFYADYIRSWDVLKGYCIEGVSDVYIVEEMCFDLPAVKQVVGEKVQIRVIPHIAQSAWYQTPAMKKFFIRPDDVDEYARYVNVLEFKNIQNPNAAVTMAKIYQDKGWAGKLSEIISDFDIDIDNRDILPMFATFRIGCGRRCAKTKGGCDLCMQFAKVAKTIEDKGLLNDKYHEFSN